MKFQVTILSELMQSGKASDKLLFMYIPFLGLGILAILRGLVTPSRTTSSMIGKRPMLGRKKKAWDTQLTNSDFVILSSFWEFRICHFSDWNVHCVGDLTLLINWSYEWNMFTIRFIGSAIYPESDQFALWPQSIDETILMNEWKIFTNGFIGSAIYPISDQFHFFPFYMSSFNAQLLRNCTVYEYSG